MASKISRLKLARYTAERITAGDTSVIRELAAYLVESKRVDELDLIVREIDEQFEKRGIVTVRVTGAQAVGSKMRDEIAKLLGADQLIVSESIDPAVLGGIKLETASRRLDATLAARINSLKNPKGLKV